MSFGRARRPIFPRLIDQINRQGLTIAKRYIPSTAIEKALREERGNVSRAAERLGVHRESLSYRISQEPALQVILREAREALVDLAESALVEAVKEREGWAVCFTLKTQGKKRGYVERQELVQDVTLRRTEELTDEQLLTIAASDQGGSGEGTSGPTPGEE